MSSADLTKATRELFVRSKVDEIHMRTPVVEEMQRRNKVTYKGGRYIERLVTKANIDDLVQMYETNDTLIDQKKDVLAKPRFTWRYGTLPLRYDVDEYTQNIHAGTEIQLWDLAALLVEKGQDATRLALCKQIFNSGTTTAVADAGTDFQSLVSALKYDSTYGTLSRSFSAGTNDWWQGADPAGLGSVVTSSSQDTAYNLTVNNLRKWITESDVAHYMRTPDDLYICMCPTLYNKLRAEMEAKVEYRPAGDTQRQGFNKMWLDGHQIVSVPYLQTSTTMKTWLFILNMRYWELRIHSLRNFNMTDFKWQGDISNGHDYWLARIMWSGNFVCWKPNSSMFLSAVS